MSSSKLPLYPKISSVYNKIMQFAFAVVLTQENQFNLFARNYIAQTAVTVRTFFDGKKRNGLSAYVNSLTALPIVSEVVVYDSRGQTLAASQGSSTVKQHFALLPGYFNPQKAYVPFIAEVRDQELLGYIRINLDKEFLTGEIRASLERQFEIFKLLLVLAAMAGIFFMRSFNRLPTKDFKVFKP
jgi:membrane protein